MNEVPIEILETNAGQPVSAKSPGLWKAAWLRFKKRRLNVIALRFILFLATVAVLADFLAYDKPLLCKYQGTFYSPVLADYCSAMGLCRWDRTLINQDWHELQFDWAIWAPVRYLPHNIDYKNQRLTSPFAKQRVPSWKSWHYFGTDRDGRDVLSGLIHGTRISLTIGLVVVSISAFIGILMGAFAGFYGDTRFQMTTIGLLAACIGIVLGYFYGFQVRSYTLSDALAAGPSSLIPQFLLSLVIFLGVTLLCIQIVRPLHRIPFLGKRRFVWIDIIVSRIIEIMSTIPTLLLIITVMALTEKRSVFFLMVILGVLSWPSVARLMRAEMLRTRSQEFIEAARAIGYSNLRVMLRHAIPNSLAPVIVAMTFGVASAIILEAVLSFLGIGVPDTVVTWGGLLRASRTNISAWWLSVFPGLAVFLTVIAINLIGEGLRDALDPRLRHE
jgi:peptide/nickel transport system permease protein